MRANVLAYTCGYVYSCVYERMCGFEVRAVEVCLESAITNNIPVEVAQKQDMTPESMFTEWMDLFRAHVQGRSEFTIEPSFKPNTRVRDWYSLCQLVKEICPDIYTRNQQWLGGLIADEERP